MFISSWCSN